MFRDLTKDFLPAENLKYPVKVYHEIFKSTDDLHQGSIVFILNPKKINQNELRLLFRNDACFVFFKSSMGELSTYETHPVKLLLNDKNVNEHLERIKGLQKNILEMSTVKFHTWDFLGLTTSYRQLFNIRGTGYCFMEYPVISENTINLDDVFIQESLNSISPRAIVSKYLQIVETSDGSRLEQINRSNAFQKVFKFYKSDNESYRFSLDIQDVEFLVDVLKLEGMADKPLYRAEIIGALTSACSYFIHAGYSESYEAVIRKIMLTTPPDGCNTIGYKHITEKDLEQLKNSNTFLYYHLTCRIPNQYAIALFDMYLTEIDAAKRIEMGNAIEQWLTYLKNKVLELSLANVNLVWEFKRDQEIGAMSGTVGLLTLYKKACIDSDMTAYEEAGAYINKAIEYAHPSERNRDVNYYVQCRLSELISKYSSHGSVDSRFQNEIDELAMLYAGRFKGNDGYDAFDVMFSVSIVAISCIFEGEERARGIYRRIGLDWGCLGKLMDEYSYQYVAFLMTGFLMLAPKDLVKELGLDAFIQKAMDFFKLNDEAHTVDSVMDIIAVKFMIAHGYYLSKSEGDEYHGAIGNYRNIINNSPLYTKWADGCDGFFEDCMKHSASGRIALKLIYSIPY